MVVIRNLHYSIPVPDIEQEIEKHGDIIRNILNIRQSKETIFNYVLCTSRTQIE